ncbi:MAG: enoyl-CoA hydratase-related protein [Anaerolineales bacterium]|jgi:enoyl-CoA hydratase
MYEENLTLIERDGAIAILKLNRPGSLNALSPEMLASLCTNLDLLAQDKDIRVIVITGDQRAFAAGADIISMAELSPIEMFHRDTLAYWHRIWSIEKPLIAAVSGYAYGGGCELAMSCDLIVASENARFAQPEIKLGIMPGAGGTQRLTKALGPYRAMEMILTGEPITAQEAHSAGLVNRVVPVERLLDEARELAYLIAKRPPIAIRLARQAVRYGVENSLTAGLQVERRNFLLLFDTADQKEGMRAFIEKRPPHFEGS